MAMIDRYVLRLFFKSLIVCFLSIGGLFIVVDAFSNVDRFVSYAQEKGSVVGVLWNFYGARMLSLFDFSSGLLVLIAAMFTVTWLHRTNEFTALLAAGLPKARIVLPLLAASVIISLLGAVNRELLIPRFREHLSHGWKDLVGSGLHPMEPTYDNETNVLFDGKHIIERERKIEEAVIRLPVGVPGIGRQLSAAEAIYVPAKGKRPGGYLLRGVKQPIEEMSSVLLGKRPVVYAPQDASWLEGDQLFVASRLTFTHMTADKAWRQWSSARQLIGALRNPSMDFGADVRVAVHLRLVKPLLDLTLLFLGLPMVLSPGKTSVFAAAGWCFLLVTAFYLVVVACQGLGSNYMISPVFAAWCPLMVFTPIAYANGVAFWS